MIINWGSDVNVLKTVKNAFKNYQKFLKKFFIYYLIKCFSHDDFENFQNWDEHNELFENQNWK